MTDKIKEKLSAVLNSDKKVKIFAIIGIIGIVLILLSEAVPHNTAKSSNNNQLKEISYSDYIASLEKDTQNIIGSINGVGKCKVMLTLKDTNESVYAKNSNEKNDDSSYSKSYEYVLYDGQDGETPVLIKQYFPQIQGVVVVCEGADNTVVRENVINSVSSLFNIPTSRISVSKIKQ